jgi:hypothetical protein
MKDLSFASRGFMSQKEIVQGNCTAAASTSALGLTGPGLKPLKPGQCVLVTSTPLMHVQRSLWLSNLYIRYQAAENYVEALLACSGKDCNLWLTSVTFEGGSSYVAFAVIVVSGGQLYAEGVHADHTHIVSSLSLS